MESVVCNKPFVCEYCGLSFDGYKFEGEAMLKVHQLTNHLFDKHKTGYMDAADSKNKKLDTGLEGLYTGCDPLPNLITQLSDFQKNAAVTNSVRKGAVKGDGMQEARAAKVVKQGSAAGYDYHCQRRGAPLKVGEEPKLKNGRNPTNTIPVHFCPKNMNDFRQVCKRLLRLTSSDIYVNISPVVAKYIDEYHDSAFYKRFGVRNVITFIKAYMNETMAVRNVGGSIKIRRLRAAEIHDLKGRTELTMTVKKAAGEPDATNESAAKLRHTAKRHVASNRDRDWVAKRPARVSHGSGKAARTTASPLQPYSCAYSTALVDEIKFQMHK